MALLACLPRAGPLRCRQRPALLTILLLLLAPVADANIYAFTDADGTTHFSNVPQDKRAAFVAAVEAKAGIEFAG